MSEQDEIDVGSRRAQTRVTGTEALKAHATLTVGLVLCTVAFWFELRRALGGNSLSWAYVFEWPLLGIFAVYMWWKVIHPLTPSEETAGKRKNEAKIAPEFDGMLAAWQAHQAELVKNRERLGGPGAEKP